MAPVCRPRCAGGRRREPALGREATDRRRTVSHAFRGDRAVTDLSRFDRPPPDAADRSWGALAERAPTDPVEADRFADALLEQLSPEERIGLLSGDDPLVRGLVEMLDAYNRRALPAGAVPRLGIPGIRFSDGPRGVVMYRSTAFPTPMARAATFDPDLEERVGDVIGVEVRSQGANLFAGVCINLLRHPAWGRAQETYGEDSHLLGEMGAALTRGVQRHAMACVKHYALNSMENSRFWVDVRVDPKDLSDVYLPHFRRVVDEGVASVMSAYNRVNGTFCGHHHHLLREVLKGEWGFPGFVMSDFTFGVRGPRAVEAGMDLEMPQRMWFAFLPQLVRGRRIAPAVIDDAARRLLRTQVRFAARGEPERYGPDAVACAEHRALAREAATRAIVLLRNDDRGGGPVLPLDPQCVRRLAVVGSLAAAENLGDHGSSRVHPPEVVTVLDGLRAVAGRHGVEVVHDDGTDPARAAVLAASCDAAVTVVGTTWRDEGEWVGRSGGDRSSLRLPGGQEALARAVGRAATRHAVVLMGGSAFVTDALDDAATALVVAWYPGMEGGHAVADVLFGEAEPEGRLPVTWPAASTTLPPFRRFARRIRYGPLHGYRLMEATRQRPAHPFGHGLTYTTFSWGEPAQVGATTRADGPGGDRLLVRVAVPVTNTGGRPGTEVVQAYVPEVLGTHPRALLTLRGAAVARSIAPGETRSVVVEASVPWGASSVAVGPSSDPAGHRVVRLADGPSMAGT